MFESLLSFEQIKNYLLKFSLLYLEQGLKQRKYQKVSFLNWLLVVGCLCACIQTEYFSCELMISKLTLVAFICIYEYLQAFSSRERGSTSSTKYCSSAKSSEKWKSSATLKADDLIIFFRKCIYLQPYTVYVTGFSSLIYQKYLSVDTYSWPRNFQGVPARGTFLHDFIIFGSLVCCSSK